MRPEFALHQWLARRIAIDRRALAAFRVALGLCLLADIALRWSDLGAFYTDSGVLPRSTLTELYPVLGDMSPLAVSGAAWLPLVALGLTALAGVALVVGYRPRLSAGIAFILLVSIQLRNPVVLNAGDTLLRRLLFWSLLLPLGCGWDDELPESATRVATAGTAGILLQVLAVYVTNSLIKFRGTYWHRGTAVRYVFQLDHLTVRAGDVVAGWDPALVLGNWLWLGLLVGSPLLLIWTGRYRTGLVVAFVTAHICIALSFLLGVFPLVSILGLVLFFPPSFWDALADRWPTAIEALRPRWPESATGPPQAWFPTTTQSLAVLGIVAIVLLNAVAVGFVAAPTGTPDRIEDRSWNMFAPDPPQETWWYAAPAPLESGNRVDALTGETVNLSRPPEVSDRFPNQRWKKFLGTARHEPSLRRSLATYLCSRWNQSHDDTMERVELIFLTESTNLSGPESVDREQLGSYQCA
ncbi:HTTM domain-containing protein [Haloarcula sp. H-GB4]|uniref:HTTM domain-containing protein n=1 Tax=Haloarcula sp. H-GB4 TaxID=3069755 RepID=UPI0027B5743E|nr:HTTM domain-containing protein [Haloarcula sp. H-GB4]MDQ2072568.1 HTTM domain-containing protein [Haloarcula sp. H-GB4]